jgi:hypothetical protein
VGRMALWRRGVRKTGISMAVGCPMRSNRCCICVGRRVCCFVPTSLPNDDACIFVQCSVSVGMPWCAFVLAASTVSTAGTRGLLEPDRLRCVHRRFPCGQCGCAPDGPVLIRCCSARKSHAPLCPAIRLEPCALNHPHCVDGRRGFDGLLWRPPPPVACPVRNSAGVIQTQYRSCLSLTVLSDMGDGAAGGTAVYVVESPHI